jgi:c-di-GMP phosphodiesterase
VDIYVARQPIFDLERRLFGYELLYRPAAGSTAASGASSDQMSTGVIVHSIVDIGLERITAGHRAFLNCSREVLLGGYVDLLAPRAFVIEVLETIEPDAEIVGVCAGLRDAGYTIALDDFEYHPRFDPLLEIAQIVKLDVLGRTEPELVRQIEPLRPFDVQLLAERVEDEAMYELTRQLGCSLFQGYHFARPETLANRKMAAGTAAVLRLMNLLVDDTVAEVRVEEAFRSDVALTYKLLRIVNSAAVGGRDVESILHAIRLIGREALSRWLGLVLVGSLGSGNEPDRETALTAMSRGRFCEALAERRRDAGPSFMVGLFSLLDVLMGMPLEQILESLDLAPGVADALIRREGPFAQPLALVEAYEQGRWDEAGALAERMSVEPHRLPEIYIESLGWARDRFTEATAD